MLNPWQPWFAWRPVWAPQHTMLIAWLIWCERRRVYGRRWHRWEYRQEPESDEEWWDRQW